MKKLIATLGLSLITTSLFAARLPTSDEWLQQMNDFEKAPSIAKYIDYLKQDKYDMFTSITSNTSSGIEVTPNRSHFAISTVLDRLNPINPLGSVQENLTFLKLLINKGLKLNGSVSEILNPKEYQLSMLNAASRNCSSDTIKFLLDNGASNESSSGLWMNSLFSDNFRANETMTSECLKSVKLLIKGQTDISVEDGSWHWLVQTNAHQTTALYNRGPNLYLRGILLDQEIADTIKNVFKIIPSKKPTSPRPDDKMISDIDSKINNPYGEADVDEKMLYFWNNLNADQKEWACYRSSLDEGLEYLQSRGFNLNELKTKILPEANPRLENGFGSTWIDVIFPYCESLK